MKEMTSAEFKRANFEELTEPVAIKRYKDVRGYYYPVGQQPPEVAEITSEPLEPALDIATMFREIARDMRQLAADIPCSDPLFHDHG